MWINRGKFWELSAPQRSAEWFKARKYRVTASNYEGVMGLSPFNSRFVTVSRILGISPPVEQNEAMRLGIENEPVVRGHYQRIHKRAIVEPSLCLFRSDYDFHMDWMDNSPSLSSVYGSQDQTALHPYNFIAGSPDGFVTVKGEKRNIEIKFTKKIYDTLRKPRSATYPGGEHEFGHIFRSHYMQMQGCMAITGAKTCDYLVSTSERLYEETIPFNKHYWYQYMLPELVKTVETQIKPSMPPKSKREFENALRLIERK